MVQPALARFGRIEPAVEYRAQPLEVVVTGREVRMTAAPDPVRASVWGAGPNGRIQARATA